MRAEVRGGSWSWPGYGLACVALLYTHHYALFTIAAQFVFLALYCVSLIGAGDGDLARRLATRVAAVGAIVALAYLPAAQFLLVQADRVREDYWIGPLDLPMLCETFGQFVVPVESAHTAPWWGWAVLVHVRSLSPSSFRVPDGVTDWCSHLPWGR